MNTRYCFGIADIVFSVEWQEKCKIMKSFQPFIMDETEEYQVEFQGVKKLSKMTGPCVYKGRSFCVYKEPDGFRRYFYDGLNDNYIYAVGKYDWTNKKILIEYIPYGRQFLNETGNSFYHIAWEALLMHENRMIMHSACVDTKFGGILFAGVSGAGKSTQAELWCQHEDAVLINGDRTIIHPTDKGWFGYGSPYAGSSKCYRNEKSNIRAIVFPKKDTSCGIRRIGIGEAFRKLYSCMTINSWDEEFVSNACDFITRLVQEIPVFELSCTPNEDSIECLKKRLLEDV